MPDRTQNTKPKTQATISRVRALCSLPRALFGSFVFSASVPSQKKGFTLIEILVAITLFTVIMTSAVGSLIAINDANRKTQAVRAAIDNVNFALDSISRRLRTGTNYNCLNISQSSAPPELTYLRTIGDLPVATNCPTGSTAMVFKASNSLDGGPLGDLVAFRLGPADIGNDGNRSIEVATRPPASGSPWNDFIKMTSPEVHIENLNFIVIGAGSQSPDIQPYVLITVRGSVDTSKGKRVQKTTFRVQTTVSQRLIDR